MKRDVAGADDAGGHGDRELGGGEVEVHAGDLGAADCRDSSEVRDDQGVGRAQRQQPGAQAPAARHVRPVVRAQVDARQADHGGDRQADRDQRQRPWPGPAPPARATTATPIHSVE